MKNGNTVPLSWFSPARNCWALQTLQVELVQSARSRGDIRCEVVTEDHWQVIFMLEGELQECVVNDNGCHLQQLAGEERCSLRYLTRGMRLNEGSQDSGGGRLLIRLASPELFGTGRLRREADELQRQGAAALTIPATPQMLRTAADILAHSVRPDNLLPVMSGALDLLRQIAHSRELSRVPSADREKSAVDAACKLLEASMDNPPSLEELATQVGMSATRFKQAFSRIRGVPPFAYLRNLRLERAMCLLRYEGLRVTEVALEVGYNNFSHFAKIFEARFGIVPSRVRRETMVRLVALLYGLHALALCAEMV
ncbi:helix-turn-helix transcriptional regulator [Pelobacter propionicus]|uniref:Transcriptional regulator, AraC family n=1 Tax=Pelobacter propionicus (strain DSM 2379 / NBRC 103807 / OttBd1) TaxID=338966 RepID=A1AM63_PELPD|nr:AraC family transcriptional regulator [Pelobacter propionicus]ABK98433.1 transcriptional regulator, AraC family [Pelobacter propionicus DSM 2379]